MTDLICLVAGVAVFVFFTAAVVVRCTRLAHPPQIASGKRLHELEQEAVALDAEIELLHAWDGLGERPTVHPSSPLVGHRMRQR